MRHGFMPLGFYHHHGPTDQYDKKRHPLDLFAATFAAATRCRSEGVQGPEPCAKGANLSFNFCRKFIGVWRFLQHGSRILIENCPLYDSCRTWHETCLTILGAGKTSMPN